MTPQLTTYIEKEFPAGDEAAKKRLQEFIEKRGRDYKANRDVPSLNDGTSKLSPYLSSGIISARQCIVAARSANQNKMDSGSDGLVTWISELCWRDFYKVSMDEVLCR